MRWYSDASEYTPHEGAVNGAVRFVEIFEAHEENHSCLMPNFLQPAHNKQCDRGRALQSKSALLLREQSLGFRVSAKLTGNHFGYHLTRVRYKRDAAIAFALRLATFFLVYYGNDRVFPLLWNFPLAPEDSLKFVELQQDGPVMLKTESFSSFMGRTSGSTAFAFANAFITVESPSRWARSGGDSRRVAAAASSECRDLACPI